MMMMMMVMMNYDGGDIHDELKYRGTPNPTITGWASTRHTSYWRTSAYPCPHTVQVMFATIRKYDVI